MIKKYLFLLLLSLIPYIAFNQVDTVLFDQLTAEHHLQIIKLKDKLSTAHKKYKIKIELFVTYLLFCLEMCCNKYHLLSFSCLTLIFLKIKYFIL